MTARAYALRRGWLRAVVRVADALGRRCVHPRSLPPQPRTVLCIRLERWGDAVLLMPALARARQAWPGAQLTWMVLRPYAQFAASLEAADVIWPVGSRLGALWAALLERGRARRFDLAIEFHGEPRTIFLARLLGRRVVGSGVRGGGFWLDLDASRQPWPATGTRCRRLVEAAAGRPLPPLPPAPRLRPDPAAQLAASQLRQGLAPGYVILHIGCGQPAKLWPLHSWRELLRALARRGWPILVSGSASDRAVGLALLADDDPARVRCLTGATTWPVLTALVAEAAAVVAGDTGIIHLAHALGTPSLALFGPTDPQLWGYAETHHRSLARPLECSYCNRGRCPRVARSTISPCLSAMPPAEVLSALLPLLAQTSAPPAPGRRGLPALPVATVGATGPVGQSTAWSAPLR